MKLAVESKRPLTQTARELGVSKDTLYGWVRQYHGEPQPGHESVISEHLYEELKRLRREVPILKEERDIFGMTCSSRDSGSAARGSAV